MKDFLWFFITIMPILFGLPHMIQPTVMTIVNVFITGIASLFISLEPDKTRVTGNFYRNVVERAILSAFYMFIPVFLIMVYCIISQLAMTQTFDSGKLLTYFENGEVTQLGWIPITHTPHASIRCWDAKGVAEYTDVDTELFGLTYEEVWNVRAAFALLQKRASSKIWKAAWAKATNAAALAFKADKTKAAKSIAVKKGLNTNEAIKTSEVR